MSGPHSRPGGSAVPRPAERAPGGGPAADSLATRLHGRMLRTGEAGYEEARRIWNGMIDRRPALIVQCADDADAAAAVTYARDHGLTLSVRGGGHGVAGQAVCDGGLMVDLSGMRAVEVDPRSRTVRAQGGCTLGDVDHATQQYGLAAPLGVVSRTGIAGLTLSGGMGWLRRQHGLSCDNLLSATVVTAEGSVRTASESENQDLFWAIRGGGGNFGIVTSFTYRLHPVGPEVFFCFTVYPAEYVRQVLRACEAYVTEVPDQVSPIAVLGRVPRAEGFPEEAYGHPFAALLALYAGSPADGERFLWPLRDVTDPICDLSAAMPYTAAQRLLDEDYPDGGRYYWKSLNTPELSDELIERLAAHAAAAPSPATTVDLWYQGGAMARTAEDATAFANRRSPYLIGIEANWEADADSPANLAWVRDAYADLRTFSTGGTYLNFPGFLEEGKRLLRDGYGGNLERLAEVKARYDPDNFFHLNANIEPRPSTR